MCHLSLDTVPKISNPQCDQCVGSTWREPTVRRVHREVRHAAITCRLAPMTWNVSPSLRTTKLQTVCITCIQFLWFHDVPSKWQHGMFLRVSKYHIPAQEFYASNISKHRYLENRTSTSVLFSADSIPCRTRCLASSVHEDFYLKVKLLRYTHVAIWIVSYHACKDATRPISFAWAFCGHHECKLAVIMNQNASFLMWWKLKINHVPTQAYVHWKMIWCIYGCFHCCRTWKTITQTPPVLDDILSRADPVVCAPQGRVMTSTFPWQPVNRALPVTLSPGPKSPCGKTRCQHGQPDIFCRSNQDSRNQKTMSKQKPFSSVRLNLPTNLSFWVWKKSLSCPTLENQHASPAWPMPLILRVVFFISLEDSLISDVRIDESTKLPQLRGQLKVAARSFTLLISSMAPRAAALQVECYSRLQHSVRRCGKALY